MRGNFTNEKAIFGGALRESAQRQGEVPGAIVRVNPLQGSCDVSARGNYYANIPLPGLSRDVEGSGGEFQIPRRGTPVLLRLGVGWPTISQILPISANQESIGRPSFPVDPSSSSGAGLFSNDDGPTYLGRLPRDLHFGERVG